MCAGFVFVRMFNGGMRVFVRVRFAFVVRMLVLGVVVRMLVRVRRFFVFVFVFVVGHFFAPFIGNRNC